MKITDDRRLFTYPVLSEGRNDYKTCEFIADIKPFFDTANNLVLKVDCPANIYREIFHSSLENFSCKIPRDRVKREINCVGLVVLRRDVKNFHCSNWNEDFEGMNFNLSKGSILAYKNLPTIKINEDANIFKNVASIFSIYRRAVDGEPCEIDLSKDKIKIGLNAKEYVSYRKYCSKPELQPILNAMIIFPALVYIFEELKADDDFELYGAKTWFLSLKAAYRRKKINFAEHVRKDENTSFKLAQEVMALPISKALENIAHIYEDGAEDS